MIYTHTQTEDTKRRNLSQSWHSQKAPEKNKGSFRSRRRAHGNLCVLLLPLPLLLLPLLRLAGVVDGGSWLQLRLGLGRRATAAAAAAPHTSTCTTSGSSSRSGRYAQCRAHKMRIITRLRTRAGLVTHLPHTRPAGRQAKRGTDRQRSVSSETAAEEEID
jgi:hypothetical protein